MRFFDTTKAQLYHAGPAMKVRAIGCDGVGDISDRRRTVPNLRRPETA
jgi:hypothetical protein